MYFFKRRVREIVLFTYYLASKNELGKCTNTKNAKTQNWRFSLKLEEYVQSAELLISCKNIVSRIHTYLKYDGK